MLHQQQLAYINVTLWLLIHQRHWAYGLLLNYTTTIAALPGERSLRAAADSETKNKNLMPPCSRSRSTRSIACLIYNIVIKDGWNRSRSFDLILIILVTAADSDADAVPLADRKWETALLTAACHRQRCCSCSSHLRKTIFHCIFRQCHADYSFLECVGKKKQHTTTLNNLWRKQF